MHLTFSKANGSKYHVIFVEKQEGSTCQLSTYVKNYETLYLNHVTQLVAGSDESLAAKARFLCHCCKPMMMDSTLLEAITGRVTNYFLISSLFHNKRWCSNRNPGT